MVHMHGLDPAVPRIRGTGFLLSEFAREQPKLLASENLTAKEKRPAYGCGCMKHARSTWRTVQTRLSNDAS